MEKFDDFCLAGSVIHHNVISHFLFRHPTFSCYRSYSIFIISFLVRIESFDRLSDTARYTRKKRGVSNELNFIRCWSISCTRLSSSSEPMTRVCVSCDLINRMCVCKRSLHTNMLRLTALFARLLLNRCLASRKMWKNILAI